MSPETDNKSASAAESSAALFAEGIPAAGVPDGALELGTAMADAADTIAARYFRQTLDIEHKADASPVTIADKETETAMRSLIAERFPDHGIFGEEHGTENLDARHVWVIDPIDGTASFSIGSPMFGTLIALLENGRPVLGIINCPAMNERWIGARGRPTTLNDRIIRTRACTAVSAAWMSSCSPAMFQPGEETDRAERLRAQVRRAVWGMDCYAYGLIASGSHDIVCESDLKPYDYMALAPVIEGAGGRVTTWTGEPLSLTSGARVLACGDPAVHAEAVELLAR